jgi:hypothetical protein
VLEPIFGDGALFAMVPEATWSDPVQDQKRSIRRGPRRAVSPVMAVDPQVKITNK